MLSQEKLKSQEDTYHKFEEVPAERRLSNRRDLNGFLLLDKIMSRSTKKGSDTEDVVAAAEHDEIYLCGDLEVIAAYATDEELLDLMRSGVRFGEYDGLEKTL